MTTYTTTAHAVRDRAIEVLARELAPASLGDVGYRLWPDEQGKGRFAQWCEANPAAAFRLFFVRDTGWRQTPAVITGDVAEELLELELRIAYPQDLRAGELGATDRDRVMREDGDQVYNAIGLLGRQNFTGPTYPDACWRGPHAEDGGIAREEGDAIDFVVIRVRLAFYVQR